MPSKLLTALLTLITLVSVSPAIALEVVTQVDRSSYSWFGSPLVTATVTQGGAPVTDCDLVQAECSAAPGETAQLLDDGLPPDILSGDGIYTGTLHLGGETGIARATGTYTVTARAWRDTESGSDPSPGFSLYSVRRWSGINTSSATDIYDRYTDFVVEEIPGGWHHRIVDLGLVRSTADAEAQIRIPVIPAENTIDNLTVSGNGVSGVNLRGNLIEFDCDLTLSGVTRVTIEFDAPGDLAATRIDRYHTGDFAQRNFRNGYVVWNRYLNTGILGSDYTSPHGPGCVVDLHVTDLESGQCHTIDCMERVAIHLDGSAVNDGTGTYPSNIKWSGDAVQWLVSADLDTITFAMDSGGLYGLADRLQVRKTVSFAASSRMFRHLYRIENIHHQEHEAALVWGREQWLYGTNSGSNRGTDDRGLLPNDPALYGGEYSFAPSELDGNWFAAYDRGSHYTLAVIMPGGEQLPDESYLLCNPPLGGFTGEYPVNVSGYCTNMENIFFEQRFGLLQPGERVAWEFWQWGGYGEDRQELTHLIWRDAVRLSGHPLAMEFTPLGSEVPVNGSIELLFNNPMDHQSVAAALTVTPPLPDGGEWSWSGGDTRGAFTPGSLLTPETEYQVMLDRRAVDQAGHPLATEALWSFTTGSTITAVAEGERGAAELLFTSISPNPCRAGCEISFTLGRAATTSVTVFDVSGRRVRLLTSGPRSEGDHHLGWDTRDDAGTPVASGVYFCRLETDERRDIRKLVLLR